MAPDQPETILRFEDVSLYFDEQPALDHVSFELKAGESCVILGAAGSGKTVLLKTAIGLLKPDSGHIWLFGRDITTLPESELVDLRSRVGILFQEGALFDSLTIEENVAYPLLYQRSVRCPRDQVRSRVEAALRRVELEHTLDKYPSELSGGMRRRVGIARANVTEPPLVLYDSPTAGLDPITANTIMSLILKERDTKNTTTVIVTHRYQDGHMLANFRFNPATGKLEPVAHHEADGVSGTKFLVLRDGRLVFEGSQRQLEASTDPYVKKFVKPLRN
jgi:phospholipid/cholesterol/gamma-HCH transport system ATP-binding protein